MRIIDWSSDVCSSDLTRHIKRHLKQRTQSPPTPTERALDQLVKGCEIAIHNAKILTSQNQHLLAENQRQKRKRAQKRSYIARGGEIGRATCRARVGQYV